MGRIADVLLILVIMELLRVAVRLEAIKHAVETTQEDVRRLYRTHVIRDEIRDTINTTINTGPGAVTAGDGKASGERGIVVGGRLEGDVGP